MIWKKKISSSSVLLLPNEYVGNGGKEKMIRETYLPGSRTVESLKCRCDYKNNKLYFTGKGQ